MKRYVREEGTELVRRWLGSATPATSRLTEVEVASALTRRCREGAFDVGSRDRALAELVRDLEALTIVEIVPPVTARARALLARYALRAGDALQLAACLVLRDRADVEFVAFDQRLNETARAEGLRVSSG